MKYAVLASAVAFGVGFWVVRRSIKRRNRSNDCEPKNPSQPKIGALDENNIQSSVSTGCQVQFSDDYRKYKMRHLILPSALSPTYLQQVFPEIKANFQPQKVIYNGGVEWSNSCYMDIAMKMKPATEPHLPLKQACYEILLECDRLFTDWYRMQHGANSIKTLTRLQSFVTRYRPQAGENQLARHVDGRNVHGSVILGLPTDEPFEGGGITVWDGVPQQTLLYPILPGDGSNLSRADSRDRGIHEVNAKSVLESFSWIRNTGSHGMQLQGGDKFEQSKQGIVAHPLDDETRRLMGGGLGSDLNLHST